MSTVGEKGYRDRDLVAVEQFVVTAPSILPRLLLSHLSQDDKS